MGEDIEVLILEETKVIAIGIEQLLGRILKSKRRYYFDDPNESLDVLEKK